MKYRIATYSLILFIACFIAQVSLSEGIFFNIVKSKLKNMPSSELEKRLLTEYGSLWTNNNFKVLLPPNLAFNSEQETSNYQNKLKLAKFNSNCVLQEEALKNLQKAQQIAQNKGLSISPRGIDSCLRSYKTTKELWLSRVEPNLAYYVQKGKISASEATRLKKLSTWEQVKAILQLEEQKGLSFDKYRQGSILNSVAAPGSSQHLSGLAFDLAEYNNAQTRKIMNECGWWQTVKNDLPHFTYLGMQSEAELQKAGLKMFKQSGFTFWIPNL